MNIMDRAFEWLQAEGYAPKHEEGGILVKYQGGIFFIPKQEEGASLLRVDYAIPREENLPAEDTLLKMLNAIHINMPLSKCLVYSDALVFTSSTLVCEQDELGKVLTVLFDVTLMSVQNFATIVEQEAKEAK